MWWVGGGEQGEVSESKKAVVDVHSQCPSLHLQCQMPHPTPTLTMGPSSLLPRSSRNGSHVRKSAGSSLKRSACTHTHHPHPSPSPSPSPITLTPSPTCIACAPLPQCALALREADALTTEALACSLCCCCYYNEAFSALVLDDLLLQTATHASNELKQSYKVLTDVLVRSTSPVVLWPTSQ